MSSEDEFIKEQRGFHFNVWQNSLQKKIIKKIIIIREKSNEFISNAHESRGRVCSVQSHDSQFTSQTVPCAPSKATPPLSSPWTMAIHHQGAEVSLEGGRTATQATSGREKHPLQLRFLRNPHQPRMGKYPHSQTGLLLTLSTKITYRRRRKMLLGSLILQARPRKGASHGGPRKKQVWFLKICSHRQGSQSNLHIQTHTRHPDEKVREKKYPDGIFRWTVSSHRDPSVNNQEIITWPSLQMGNESDWI